MNEYSTDILAWSEHQGALLRRRASGELVNEAELDWPNLAEEIETLGRSERRALESHIRTIIEHLAKLLASPATAPRGGWIETVVRTRLDVKGLLRDSPSLRPRLPGIVSEEHESAIYLTAMSLHEYKEVPRVPLDTIQFSVEQILGPWLPED